MNEDIAEGEMIISLTSAYCLMTVTYPPIHRLHRMCQHFFFRLIHSKGKALKVDILKQCELKSDCDLTKAYTETTSTDVLIYLKDKHIRTSLKTQKHSTFINKVQ